MASVLVFCSSSQHISPMYFSEMELFANELVEAGHSVVYGGAEVGLMGHLADKALARNGKVSGVIPSYLNVQGIVHSGLTELTVVPNLMDRKRQMLQLCDIVVAFPGGLGTLDEVSEVLALRQLGETDKPVLFLNFLDFWTPLIEFFTQMQQQKMVSQSFNDLFEVLESGHAVVEYINEWQSRS